MNEKLYNRLISVHGIIEDDKVYIREELEKRENDPNHIIEPLEGEPLFSKNYNYYTGEWNA